MDWRWFDLGYAVFTASRETEWAAICASCCGGDWSRRILQSRLLLPSGTVKITVGQWSMLSCRALYWIYGCVFEGGLNLRHKCHSGFTLYYYYYYAACSPSFWSGSFPWSGPWNPSSSLFLLTVRQGFKVLLHLEEKITSYLSFHPVKSCTPLSAKTCEMHAVQHGPCEQKQWPRELVPGNAQRLEHFDVTDAQLMRSIKAQ